MFSTGERRKGQSDAGQSPGIETPRDKGDRGCRPGESPCGRSKEVLRLRFELGFGQRQIARSCGIGLGTVHDYLQRAEAAGISWPLPEGLSEEELESKLFGNAACGGASDAAAAATGLESDSRADGSNIAI